MKDKIGSFFFKLIMSVGGSGSIPFSHILDLYHVL